MPEENGQGTEERTPQPQPQQGPTEDQVRAIFREELQSAIRGLSAPREEERAQARAAIAAGERDGGAAAPSPDEARELEDQALSRWSQSIEEVARKTGGKLHVYQYPRRFHAQSRGLVDIRPGGIIDRALRGDTKPAIRTLQFFRALAEGNVAEARRLGGKRALGESTLSAGGALVPEEFGQDVIAKLGELTPFATREFMRVVPMSSDTSIWPRLTTLPEATYGDENVAWSTDESKGTEPGWGEVELVAREAVLIVPVSEHVISDASINMIEYLIDLFAEALARLRNRMVLTGNGTNQPEGAFTHPGVATSAMVTTDNGTRIDSITTAYHGIPARYREGAIWVTSDIGVQILSGIKATDYQPIMGSILDEPFNRLKGKPLFETEAVGTSDPTKLLFGNFLFYLFGDRQMMQAATDRGGTFFKKRQVAVRVTERYDGKIAQPEAFYVLTGVT